MSTAGYSSSKRPGTAYAQAIAARQRRQLIFAVVLVLILVGVLAWEVPKLHLFGGKSSSAVAPVVTTPAPLPPSAKQTLEQLRKKAAADPFAAPITGAAEDTTRDVGPPHGSVDPFAAAPAAAAGSSSAPAATAPVPQQIVLGTPGAGRVATHGWIVILASIPTGDGQTAANEFAANARKRGIHASVLNSSNRKPLRGGYWVVYAGPYESLGDVSAAAGSVHVAYPGAYIRELIVYK